MYKECLFMCNTSFQIMMALEFKMTVLKKDKVDISLSDTLPDAEKVYENIKKSNVFNNVILCKEYEINYNKEYNQYATLRKMLRRKKICQDIIKKFRKKYDELYVCDTFYTTNVIYEELIRINPDIKVFYYEESPLVVMADTGNHFKDLSFYQGTGMKCLLKKILGIKNINGNFSGAYTTAYKKMEKRYFAWIDMPRITKDKKEEYIKILNSFWAFDKSDYMKLNGIIFIEESFFADGKPSCELEIMKDLVEFSSDNQIAVKLHPRTRKNRFDTREIIVLENKSIPWELLVLNNCLQNVITVCIASNAAFLAKLYWNVDQRSVMLINCIDYYLPQLDDKYYRMISEICKEKKLAYLPKTKREFQNIIKKMTTNKSDGGWT